LSLLFCRETGVPRSVHTSVKLPWRVYARWKASGQQLAAVVEWGVDAYWASVEGAPPDPLRAVADRFAADVWALAREGVITGPPGDLPSRPVVLPGPENDVS